MWKEKPEELGWYWIKRDDGTKFLCFLSRGHGQWYFDGELSSMEHGSWGSFKRVRASHLGVSFYGPLMPPEG